MMTDALQYGSVVSILVPVYNVENYIAKCVHSLCGQSYENIEFVFVNDCSTDNSMSVLQQTIEQYPERKDRIQIISHVANKGIGQTRNTLLDAATGDYLLWVDSDDFLELDAVEMLVGQAVQQQADIVTTDSFFSYRGESQVSVVKQNFPETSQSYIEGLAFHETRAALWGTLSKRSLWTTHQIRMAEGINFGEDYFATVRLFYFAKKVAVFHHPFYYYNQSNQGSYSSGSKQALHFESMIRLFDLLQDFFIQQNDLPRFESYLTEARLMDRGAYLLHTTPALRRKYASLFADVEKRYPEIKLPFSTWQRFLLKVITSRFYFTGDLAITMAKVFRRYLGVKF
ncbi:MAG: glycosyltransferase [Bacteroidota bacterium]|nr:glycosyltransferase [Bacteroidota bacterium]